MTGRTVRLWAGPDRVHVLLDGHRIKTLPGRRVAGPCLWQPFPGSRDLLGSRRRKVSIRGALQPG